MRQIAFIINWSNQTEQKTNQTEQKTVKTEQKTVKSEQKTVKSEQKSEQKNRIVAILRQNPAISRLELAIELNLHESSVQRRLKALIKENRIKRVGPDKGGTWEVIEP